MFDNLPHPSKLEKKWDYQEVLTNNPIQEIWTSFDNLANTKYMEKILNKRLKYIYKNNLLQEDDLFHLLYFDDIQNLVPNIRNTIHQARDIYFASKSLPLISRPILLFYCFEKLAELLFMITYRDIQNYRGHGISYPRNDIPHLRSAQIQKHGLFQKFHRSFSNDDFCRIEPYFGFEDIIVCGPINLKKLETYHGFKYFYSLENQNSKTSSTNNSIQVSELDREYIFVYVLSILARYNISEWSNLLSGNEILFSKNIKVINYMRNYINTVEVSFPNLILNEIYEKNISFFYPAMLMANEINEYDDKAI